jgi:hypothetical protein
MKIKKTLISTILLMLMVLILVSSCSAETN